MSHPANEAPLLTILQTLVEIIQQENTRLHQAIAAAREQHGRLVNQLLPHLPAIIQRLSTAPGSSPETSQATPTPVTDPRAEASSLHWLYPDTTVGCGLNIHNLSAAQLTCECHEVTCSGCLVKLRFDQENSAEVDARANSIAREPSANGVRVDLEALIDGCSKVIYAERGDGSPPMVVLSADVACAVAEFARTLARGIVSARVPSEVQRWTNFALAGPSVSGAGAADAWGSVVHPIHVSALWPSATAASRDTAPTYNGDPSEGAPPKPMPITQKDPMPRITTGIKPLDRMLGGGFVRGGSFLVSGIPDTGKSTLLLQAISHASLPNGNPCKRLLWATAEESSWQVTDRARRLGTVCANISVLRETRIDLILSRAYNLRPEILIVDTIQTVTSANVKAPPGTALQIQECAEALVNFAKTTGACVILVYCGDGDTVPIKLKHLVDVLLQLKMSDENPWLRRLSILDKNRFGPTVETVCLEMRDEGLCPVSSRQ